MLSPFRVCCLIVFGLALSVRTAYILVTPVDPKAVGEMERAATNLARTGELANVFATDSGPSAHVSPLYPLMLAGVNRLCGVETMTARRVQEVLAALVTSLCIALIPVVARQAKLHPAAGWTAAVMLALSPFNLWIETSGSWETPYTTLLLCLLLWSFLALTNQQWQNRRLVWVAGLTLGIAALVGPLVLVATALAFLAEWLTRPGLRLRVGVAALIMASVTLACLAPWAYRNYCVLGAPVWLRSNFGLELWIGNNPGSNGKTFGTSWDDKNSVVDCVHPCNPVERRRLMEVGEAVYMHEKQQLALAAIGHDPARFAWLTVRRAVLYWFPPVDMWSPGDSARSVRSLLFCLIGAGAFLGLCQLFVVRHRARWLLLAFVVGPSLVYLITHVNPRYSYPTFGLSVLLGCHFVCQVLAAVCFGRRRNAGTDQREDRSPVGVAA